MTIIMTVQIIYALKSSIVRDTLLHFLEKQILSSIIDTNFVMNHELLFYHNDRRVASHRRSYQKHGWIIKIDHYLETFKRKPGALSGSVALASSGYLKELYEAHFVGEPRNFIDLLDYCSRHNITDEKLKQAVRQLTQNPIKSFTTEKVKALLGNKQEDLPLPEWTQTTAMAKSQLQQLSALIN